MIHFPALRTRRLDVQLRELTIGEAVELAAVPLKGHEAAITQLLRSIVREARGAHADPGRWTVQERMMVVAHYLASTSEGGGNFQVGEGRFLDYLHAEPDGAPDVAPAGDACGDSWDVRQVTGDEAAIMEGLCASRLDWLAADMAARLAVRGKNEGRPDASTRAGEFARWVHERMGVFKAMPESDFEALFGVYRAGLLELHHLFWLELDAEGYVAMPRKGGGADLAPARFPASSTLSELALALGGGPDRSGDVPEPARGDAIPDGPGAEAQLRAGAAG